MHFSKPVECTTGQMNSNVHCGAMKMSSLSLWTWTNVPLCRGIWVAGQAEGEGGLGASGNSVYLLHSFVMNLKLFYKIKSLKRKSLICPFHLASPSKKKKLLKKWSDRLLSPATSFQIVCLSQSAALLPVLGSVNSCQKWHWLLSWPCVPPARLYLWVSFLSFLTPCSGDPLVYSGL